MGKPFDFPIHKLCKQILEKVTALPDTIAAVKTAVADMAKYVVTNNTAKKDGIISQKISYLIQNNEAHGSIERTTAGSQNWTCPNGVYQVLAVLVGAGGGGGGGGATAGTGSGYKAQGGSGGGSGAFVFAIIPVSPGTKYTLVVGSGGSGGSASIDIEETVKGGDGTDGGNTSFNNIIAEGGKKGLGGNSTKTGTNLPSVNGGNGGVVSQIKAFLRNEDGKNAETVIAPSTYYQNGSAGGRSVIGGGAGGAGGNGGSSYQYAQYKPSKGSNGQSGRALLIW